VALQQWNRRRVERHTAARSLRTCCNVLRHWQVGIHGTGGAVPTGLVVPQGLDGNAVMRGLVPLTPILVHGAGHASVRVCSMPVGQSASSQPSTVVSTLLVAAGTCQAHPGAELPHPAHASAAAGAELWRLAAGLQAQAVAFRAPHGGCQAHGTDQVRTASAPEWQVALLACACQRSISPAAVPPIPVLVWVHSYDGGSLTNERYAATGVVAADSVTVCASPGMIASGHASAPAQPSPPASLPQAGSCLVGLERANAAAATHEAPGFSRNWQTSTRAAAGTAARLAPCG
jgi:hypothetical protein